MNKVFESGSGEERFERLSALYQSDPEEFERQVREEINKVIQNSDAKYRKRLEGLQFTIDCSLRKYKNPELRLIKMVQLFRKGISEFQNAQNALLEILKNPTQSEVNIQPKKFADIIIFPSEKK